MSLIFMSAVCLMLLIVLKMRGNHSGQLVEPRAAILSIGVQIICGDCSGDDDRPIKTYLSRTGSCSRCGGRSYILASRHFLAANNPFQVSQITLQESPKWVTAITPQSFGERRTILAAPTRNPWIASSKLLNKGGYQRVS